MRRSSWSPGSGQPSGCAREHTAELQGKLSAAIDYVALSGPMLIHYSITWSARSSSDLLRPRRTDVVQRSSAGDASLCSPRFVGDSLLSENSSQARDERAAVH